MKELTEKTSEPMKDTKGTLMIKGCRGVFASKDLRVTYTQEGLKKEMEKYFPDRVRKKIPDRKNTGIERRTLWQKRL
jgi:hypothetical protein